MSAFLGIKLIGLYMDLTLPITNLQFVCGCKFDKHFLVYFEIDFCRLKIQFAELDFYDLIFQKSSTDQQGEKGV